MRGALGLVDFGPQLAEVVQRLGMGIGIDVEQDIGEQERLERLLVLVLLEVAIAQGRVGPSKEDLVFFGVVVLDDRV